MVYDPIAKKEYDRKRNARQKAEYLAKNPNYKPSRSSKYADEAPTQQQGLGFNTLLNDYYDNQPKPPPPKPKYNPNGVEARKSKDYYEDEDEDNARTPTPQIKNSLANIRFY